MNPNLVQWHKHGDHPDVRYFRRPEAEYGGEQVHDWCGRSWRDHGWIDAGSGRIVCPGDWVMNGSDA